MRTVFVIIVDDPAIAASRVESIADELQEAAGSNVVRVRQNEVCFAGVASIMPAYRSDVLQAVLRHQPRRNRKAFTCSFSTNTKKEAASTTLSESPGRLDFTPH